MEFGQISDLAIGFVRAISIHDHPIHDRSGWSIHGSSARQVEIAKKRSNVNRDTRDPPVAISDWNVLAKVNEICCCCCCTFTKTSLPLYSSRRFVSV